MSDIASDGPVTPVPEPVVAGDHAVQTTHADPADGVISDDAVVVDGSAVPVVYDDHPSDVLAATEEVSYDDAPRLSEPAADDAASTPLATVDEAESRPAPTAPSSEGDARAAAAADSPPPPAQTPPEPPVEQAPVRAPSSTADDVSTKSGGLHPTLQEMLERWRASGIPAGPLQSLEAGTPRDVVLALRSLSKHLGITSELLADVNTCIQADAALSSADVLWPESQGAISKLVGRARVERQTTPTIELIRMITGIPYDAAYKEELSSILTNVLERASGLSYAQLFDVLHYAATVATPVAAALLGNVMVTLAPSAEQIQRLATALCESAEKTLKAPKLDANVQNATVVILEQFWRLTITVGPSLRKQTPIAAIFRDRVFPLIVRCAVIQGRCQRIAVSTFVNVLIMCRENFAVEIESFVHGALLPVITSGGPNTDCAAVLEEMRNVFSEAQHLVDLFVNYDCSTGRRSVLQPLWSAVCDAASSAHEASRRKALLCVVSAVEAFGQWMDRFETATDATSETTTNANDASAAEGKASPLPANLAADLQAKKAVELAIGEFNGGRVDRSLIILEDSRITRGQDGLGRWIFEQNHMLSKLAIGEYFGKLKPERVECLSAFVDAHDYVGLSLDEALRVFLGGFKLVGEAQVVDKTMSVFAAKFMKDNPNAFRSESTAFILAFSICMLNTDAHSTNVDQKMTISGFLRNNAGIDDGEDVPHDVLEAIYDRVTKDEIRLRMGPADHVAQNAAAAAAAASASTSGGIPVLRHLVPVIGLVSDVVLLPVELAASATGISQAQDRKRASAEQAKALGQVVSDAVACMRVVGRTRTDTLTMANSVEYIIPMVQACVSSAADAIIKAVRANRADEEYDLAVRGARVTMHASCRVGQWATAIRLAVDIYNRARVVSTAPTSQAACALRSLFEMASGSRGCAPHEVWLLVWRMTVQLFDDGLLDIGDLGGSSGAESPSRPGSPMAKQEATSWFRQKDTEPQREAAKEKARQVVKAAVNRKLLSAVCDTRRYPGINQSTVVSALCTACTEAAGAGTLSPGAVAAMRLVLAQATEWATRLQWHHLWMQASRALAASAVHLRASVCLTAVRTLERVLERNDFGEHEQADIVRFIEKSVCESELVDRELTTLGRVVETNLPLIRAATWRVLSRLYGRSALDMETIEPGLTAVLEWVPGLQQLHETGAITTTPLIKNISFVRRKKKTKSKSKYRQQQSESQPRVEEEAPVPADAAAAASADADDQPAASGADGDDDGACVPSSSSSSSGESSIEEVVEETAGVEPTSPLPDTRVVLERSAAVPGLEEEVITDVVSCLLGFACNPHGHPANGVAIKRAGEVAEMLPSPALAELFVSVGTSGSVALSIRSEAIRHATRLLALVPDQLQLLPGDASPAAAKETTSDDPVTHVLQSLSTRIGASRHMREDVGELFAWFVWEHLPSRLPAAVEAWCAVAPEWVPWTTVLQLITATLHDEASTKEKEDAKPTNEADAAAVASPTTGKGDATARANDIRTRCGLHKLPSSLPRATASAPRFGACAMACAGLLRRVPPDEAAALVIGEVVQSLVASQSAVSDAATLDASCLPSALEAMVAALLQPQPTAAGAAIVAACGRGWEAAPSSVLKSIVSVTIDTVTAESVDARVACLLLHSVCALVRAGVNAVRVALAEALAASDVALRMPSLREWRNWQREATDSGLSPSDEDFEVLLAVARRS